MNQQMLMFAVIQSEDAKAAIQTLTQANLRFIPISSMSGSLHKGNVTLLSGLNRDEASRAVKVLAANCRERTLVPLDIRVGGTTAFVLPVERAVQFGAQQEITTLEAPKEKEDGMKLILAIAPEEHSNEILNALVAAQYRATLISTTGGLLRKGNATMLIGVEAEKVDGALACLEDACAAITLRDKSKTAWATVFVLDVEQYKQV